MNQQDHEKKLPEGWRWVRLGEVIREAQGGFACGTRDPQGVAQLRMNNVTIRGQFDWSSVLRVPSDTETVREYRLQEGDVLFNNTNSTELVGKTALFQNHSEVVVFSNHYTRLRTENDLLLPGFLAFWLRAQWLRGLFADICNRWIGQSAVQRDKLLALEMPLPSLAEQQRITAILSEQMAAVEKARAAAETQLEAAKALPASYLRAVFNSPEAQQWPRKSLREIATVTGGIQKSPGRAPGVFHRPFLTVRNVLRGRLDLTHIERFEITPDELSRLRLEKGDLLIVEGNGSRDQIGRNAIFGGEIEDCIHQNHIIRVRLDSNYAHPEFVSRYLNSSEGKLQMIKKAETTTGLHTLSVSKVQSLEVPVPPHSVQCRIISVFSGRGKAVEHIQQSLQERFDAINKLPAALLRRAFNGEL